MGLYDHIREQARERGRRRYDDARSGVADRHEQASAKKVRRLHARAEMALEQNDFDAADDLTHRAIVTHRANLAYELDRVLGKY